MLERKRPNDRMATPGLNDSARTMSHCRAERAIDHVVLERGGVVESPGLYLMGLQFLRRRKSALIDGAGGDARDLSAHLASYLDGEVPAG